MQHGRLTPDTRCNFLAIIPSPIRRLPTEVLVDIFGLCWGAFTPTFEDVTSGREASLATEIERLAHAPLLELSQVCAQWHAIALGTPSLWCDIQLDSLLWTSSSPISKVVALLKTALERGGESSLTLKMTDNDDSHPPSSALELLASHSERWKVADFDVFSSPLNDAMWSTIKEKLPRLEVLGVQILSDESITLDIFEVVPRLKSLTFSGAPRSISNLPLGQLSVLKCVDLLSEDLPTIISFLPRLLPAAEFLLQFSLPDSSDVHSHSEVLTLSIPHVVSNIATLSAEILDDFHGPHSSQVLGIIFSALTLPLLQSLELESQEYPRFPLSWPHAHFLSLCARSSFDLHLQSLEIYDVHITAEELLECLTSLPSLQRLAISDHQLMPDGGVDELLITDKLFAQLTRTPDSPYLVPRLCSISFQSLLKFDDNAYLAFVLSRVDDGSRFETRICWLPGHHRELDPTVVGRLEELCTECDFAFEFSAAENEWVS
ncbi:hypothetical protein C8R44DRAFT_985442 [Mycena epipterygia]|nr:hypothetical protein C8R44DRAFT_985442 [Mycena epipterygia]